MTQRTVLVVAGEASGDLLGARLIEEVRRRAPDIQLFGIGGDRLAAVGLDRVSDGSSLAVVGLTEILGSIRKAMILLRRLSEETKRRGAQHALLIDAPEFNLRLARELAKKGVQVVYYVSPQVWAWRRGRIRWIQEAVSRLLVLYPFEVEFYKRYSVPAVHVGHPLVDEVPICSQAWDSVALGTEPDPLRIVLLPGSRRSEVERLLQPMVGAVQRLAAVRNVEASLLLAPGLERRFVESKLRDDRGIIRIIPTDHYSAIAAAHLALCASGTATLEVGLLRTPMLVVYRLSPMTYWLARSWVKVPFFSLVNLVLGQPVVPELLQGEVTSDRLFETATALLANRNRLEQMRETLAQLRPRLGPPGASARAAEELLKILGM